MASDRNTPLVELIGASKIYGKGATAIPALSNVYLKIGPGEFVTIVGPSGSGKSTCLNILGCLDMPTSGRVLLGGRDVSALSPTERAGYRRDHIGFVFQGPNLIPRMSALRNVELPLVYRGVSREERRRRAASALEAVGLTNRMLHLPNELSGGQQQRVAIARAIVGRPRLLIADEPTGALDSKSGGAILALLGKLNRQSSLAVAMVTHDASIATQAPRQIMFQDGVLISDETRRHSSHAA